MTEFTCPLPHRGVVRVGGADRNSFLQGLISNDINHCVGAQMIYAALLTPQGKFLHDMFIVDGGDYFLIDCEAARADDLVQRLSRYKLRSKVIVENVSQEYNVWVNWGGDVKGDPRLPELGNRMILGANETAVGQKASALEYDKHRLALGVPDGSRDMLVEKSTLSDGNFDLLNGISWSKGCYLGQELTARMHYRALVKKRMFPVQISGASPAAGTAILLNGDEIGEMRSHCADVGVALLNVEKAKLAFDQSTPLVCAGGQLKIIKSYAL